MRQVIFSAVLFSVLISFIPFEPANAVNAQITSQVLNISEGQGETGPGNTDSNPRMVVDGDTVHMIWTSHEKDYSKRYIHYKNSTDGGKTWNAQKIIFSNDYNGITFGSDEWQLAVSGDYVHVLVPGYAGDWYGTLNYIRSVNGGASFEEPRVLVATKAYNHIRDLLVTCENAHLTIGYRYQYNAGVDNTYYLKRSDDNGDTFEDKSVYSTSSGSSWNVWDMLVKEDDIYVVYSEQYYMYGLNRRKMFFKASNDGGTSFVTNILSFPSANGEHKAGVLQSYNYVPKIVTLEDKVFVIFTAYDETDMLDLYVFRSSDKGQTFSEPLNLTKDKLPEGYTVTQGLETVAAGGSNVNIVFKCDNNAVFTIHSGDGGDSFEDPVILVDKDAYAIGKGTWPVIMPGNTDDQFYVFYTWPALAFSEDGGKTYSVPTLMAPYFSINGQIGQNFKYPNLQIGDTGDVHMAFCAYYHYGDDYDIFYRKFSFDREAESTSNKALGKQK